MSATEHATAGRGSTAIEWTEATWNPVTGCDRVSPGCAHCYALDLAARLKAMGQARYQRDGDPRTSGPGFGVTLHPDTLGEPLRWRKPRVVFVNSMSDLFHEQIPDEYILAVWAVMEAAPQHTYQILTKRPERMRALLGAERAAARPKPSYERREVGEQGHQRLPPRAVAEIRIAALRGESAYSLGKRFGISDTQARNIIRGDQWGFRVLPSVWLGVSIENRRFVHRADVLRATPAAVRFVSAEPLLGPLVHPEPTGPEFGWPELDLAGIDWLIVGGESGPKHRPMRLEWLRDLRDACLESQHRYSPLEDAQRTTPWMGTHFFFKQWGGRTPKSGGRLLDGREWSEMPKARRSV